MAVTREGSRLARLVRRDADARRPGYGPVLAAAGALALVPVVLGGDGFHVTLAVVMLAYAGYAIGFNVIFGGTGQLFLCVGALAGLSGYTAGILGNDLGVPPPLAFAAGVAAAGAIGTLLSWACARRRLEVIFVGIVTLAFSLVFTTTVQATRDLTGGETGMLVAAGAGTPLRDRLVAYYLFLGLVVAALAVHRLIERSRMGWALRALRDDPVAAALCGVDVTRYKVLAALIGSVMLGAVGALWAHYEGFVSPQTFAFAQVDIRVIVMLAFGGIGTLLGPVVGAATFTIVDELLRPFGQLRLAVYGVVLIALFLGFRRGVVPAVTGLARRLAPRP